MTHSQTRRRKGRGVPILDAFAFSMKRYGIWMILMLMFLVLPLAIKQDGLPIYLGIISLFLAIGCFMVWGWRFLMAFTFQAEEVQREFGNWMRECGNRKVNSKWRGD